MSAVVHGELNLTDEDIDDMHSAMENDELFIVYSVIKERLELVSNETKALLEFFADRFSTEERAHIWQQLAVYVLYFTIRLQKLSNKTLFHFVVHQMSFQIKCI